MIVTRADLRAAIRAGIKAAGFTLETDDGLLACQRLNAISQSYG